MATLHRPYANALAFEQCWRLYIVKSSFLCVTDAKAFAWTSTACQQHMGRKLDQAVLQDRLVFVSSKDTGLPL